MLKVMEYLPQLMEVSIISNTFSNQTTKIGNSAFSDYSALPEVNSSMSKK